MMGKQIKITPPFFEIGPKVYMYGDQAVELARFADTLVEKYGVDILFTAQYTDLRPIAENTSHIILLAQHMDSMLPGRGLGGVLPEAIKAAGAKGVMLNHAERPLTVGTLYKTILRAKELDLLSVVCADTPKEAEALAVFEPDVLLVESPALIGVGKRTEDDAMEVKRINRAIYTKNPNIRVLHGAGITDENDVYGVIACGAEATGSTSGIMKADDPFEMTERMVAAVRRAWDERSIKK